MGCFLKRIFVLAVFIASAIPARAQQIPSGAEFAGGAAVAAGIVLLGDKNSVTATTTTGTRSSAQGTTAPVAGRPGAGSGPSGPFGHPGTAGNGSGMGTDNGPLPPGGAAGYEVLLIVNLAPPIDCGVVCVVIGTATSTISSTSTISTSP
jgi:hypothetical protein